MAIACLRLFTVLPDRPLFRIPRFFSCIALRTFLPAALPYLRAIVRPPLPGAGGSREHARALWKRPGGGEGRQPVSATIACAAKGRKLGTNQPGHNGAQPERPPSFGHSAATQIPMS